MFEGHNKKWRREKDIGIKDATPGTSLSAVSGSDEVRLFYQNTENHIKLQYTTSDIEWTRGKSNPIQ